MNPDEIHAARRALGLTIAEAAARVQVLPETWRKWERGVQGPIGRNRLDLQALVAAHRAAIARATARLLTRPAEPLLVPPGDPAALAAAGAAVMLAGFGRVQVQRQEPPRPGSGGGGGSEPAEPVPAQAAGRSTLYS